MRENKNMTPSQLGACLFAATQAKASGRPQREVSLIVRDTIEAIKYTRPVRLRRSDRRGFDLQKHSAEINGLGCVDVSYPGLNNPFVIGMHGTAARCEQLFIMMMDGHVSIDNRLPEPERQERARASIIKSLPQLRGKNIACWCRLDKPCHADWILENANTLIFENEE